MSLSGLQFSDVQSSVPVCFFGTAVMTLIPWWANVSRAESRQCKSGQMSMTSLILIVIKKELISHFLFSPKLSMRNFGSTKSKICHQIQPKYLHFGSKKEKEEVLYYLRLYTDSDMFLGLLNIHSASCFPGILHKGNGENIFLSQQPHVISTVMGNGFYRSVPCGPSCSGAARDMMLFAPVALASGPDGSLYVGDFNFVRRVHPDGYTRTILELKWVSGDS